MLCFYKSMYTKYNYTYKSTKKILMSYSHTSTHIRVQKKDFGNGIVIVDGTTSGRELNIGAKKARGRFWPQRWCLTQTFFIFFLYFLCTCSCVPTQVSDEK